MIKSTYTKSKKAYKVNFELPTERAGEKRDIRVLGTFNDWSWDGGVKLKAGKTNYTGSTELPAGSYQFRYLADGSEWINDDSAETYTDSGYGTTNCVFDLAEVKEETTKKTDAKKSSPKKEAADKKESKSSAKTVAKPPKAKADKKTEKAAAKPVPPKSKTKKEAAKDATKKDDLKRIEGIGPKIAGLLNDAGITTFAQLSDSTDKKLADVLQSAGARFRLAKPGTWKEQAALAAAGKQDELNKLQDQLKGGVKR